MSNECVIDCSELVELTKQILADSKLLIKACKGPDREGVFVETARQAAQKTSQLEETVKKLKQIDTNNNKEIAQHVKIVVDSSNQVRDAMLALIKMTKTIQVTNGSTASNIDEKVTAIQTACKEMGVSIKNMITSAEAINKISKETRKGKTSDESSLLKKISPFKRSDTSPDTVRPEMSSSPPPASSPPPSPLISTRTEVPFSGRMEEEQHTLIPLLDQIMELVKRPDRKVEGIAETLQGTVKQVSHELSKLDDMLTQHNMGKEKTRMEELGTQFLNAISNCEGEKQLQVLQGTKSTLEEGLWWLQLIAGEYKEKVDALAIQEHLIKQREDIVSFKEKELEDKETKLTSDTMKQKEDKVPRSQDTREFLTNEELSQQKCLPLNDVVKTVIVKENQTVTEFKDLVFDKYYAKKLPDKRAADFVFKLPGASIYIEGSEPLILHKSIKDKFDPQRKLSLVITEKLEHIEMKELPEAVLKAEQKSSQLPSTEIFSYQGDIAEQLKHYEKNGKEVLATMIVHYNIKAASMKDLFTNDAYLQRQQALKSKSKEEQELKTLLERFDAVVNKTFDQYEGLRQIADFRSVADGGDLLMREGQSVHNLFRKMMISAEVLILEGLLQSRSFSNVNLTPFEDASRLLLSHYHAFKTGILRQCHLYSSLREREGTLSLSCSVARQFLKEVLEAAAAYIKETRRKFDDKIRTITQLPTEVQAKVYSKFKDQMRLDMEIEKHLNSLRPFVYNWLELQVVSMESREIFAKSRQELQSLLDATKNVGVCGFKEMLSSKLIEPAVKLDDLLQQVDDQIELVKFGYNL